MDPPPPKRPRQVELSAEDWATVIAAAEPFRQQSAEAHGRELTRLAVAVVGPSAFVNFDQPAELVRQAQARAQQLVSASQPVPSLEEWTPVVAATNATFLQQGAEAWAAEFSRLAIDTFGRSRLSAAQLAALQFPPVA